MALGSIVNAMRSPSALAGADGPTKALSLGAVASNPLVIGGTLAGVQLISGLFGADAQAKEEERKKKMEAEMASLQQIDAGTQRGVQNQQSAFDSIIQGLRFR